jgi:hypothetical protein
MRSRFSAIDLFMLPIAIVMGGLVFLSVAQDLLLYAKHDGVLG